MLTSTRGDERSYTFSESTCMGYASDGGMIVPKLDVVMDLGGMSAQTTYEQCVARVLSRLGGGDEAALAGEAEQVFSAFETATPVPIVRVLPWLHSAEMFHGPTGAFKDLGLGMLGKLLERREDGRALRVVVGTSGDTGSAAIHAIRGRKGLGIVVLYPAGSRISEIQRLQMTTVPDDNVLAIAVEGSSDELDVPVRAVLEDSGLVESLALTSTNSINLVRVAVQMAHFLYAGLSTGAGPSPVDVIIPSGALGNVTAACFAKHFGAPIGAIVSAVNHNDVFARFMDTGVYAPIPAVVTQSPAMDISAPYNIERLWWLWSEGNGPAVSRWMARLEAQGSVGGEQMLREDEEWAAMLARGRSQVRAIQVDDSDAAEAMRRLHSEAGYVVDPHTAVGAAAALKLGPQARPTVLFCTASPWKFLPTVQSVLGTDALDISAMPAAFRSLASLPERVQRYSREDQCRWREFLVRDLENLPIL